MAYFIQDVIEEISIVIAHVIDGATTAPGAKRSLAQRSGITPQHLSRIANGHNAPSPSTARAIADALVTSGALSATAAYAWFDLVREHADLVQRRRHAQRMRFRDDAFAAAAELQSMSDAINYVRDPAATRRALHDAVAQGDMFLRIAPFLSDQLDIARTCMVLHHAYSFVGLQVQALRVAVHAVHALERVPDAARRRDQEAFDHLVINARRTEAVALYNLKLPRAAYARYTSLEETQSFRRCATYWTAHVFRDHLNAVAALPRVALSEADQLAVRAARSLEHRQQPEDALLDVLIRESQAKVLISREKYARARRLLHEAYAMLRSARLGGALHETIVLRSMADAAWHLGARDEWRSHIDAALTLADAAGLSHQITKIREHYGAALDA